MQGKRLGWRVGYGWRWVRRCSPSVRLIDRIFRRHDWLPESPGEGAKSMPKKSPFHKKTSGQVRASFAPPRATDGLPLAGGTIAASPGRRKTYGDSTRSGLLLL